MLPFPTCLIDFTTLPGGEQCRLRILGSGGASAAVFVSERFAVKPKGVERSILEPRNGAIIAAGPTLAAGQAYDHQTRRFITSDLVWTDETNSVIIGKGTYTVLDCSVGLHHLKLTEPESGSAVEVVFEAVPYESVMNDAVVLPEPRQDTPLELRQGVIREDLTGPAAED